MSAGGLFFIKILLIVIWLRQTRDDGVWASLLHLAATAVIFFLLSRIIG